MAVVSVYGADLKGNFSMSAKKTQSFIHLLSNALAIYKKKQL